MLKTEIHNVSESGSASVLFSPSLHLSTEAEPASETLWISIYNILIFYSSDDG
jgi:hypothetical protein